MSYNNPDLWPLNSTFPSVSSWVWITLKKFYSSISGRLYIGWGKQINNPFCHSWCTRQEKPQSSRDNLRCTERSAPARHCIIFYAQSTGGVEFRPDTMVNEVVYWSAHTLSLWMNVVVGSVTPKLSKVLRAPDAAERKCTVVEIIVILYKRVLVNILELCMTDIIKYILRKCSKDVWL